VTTGALFHDARPLARPHGPPLDFTRGNCQKKWLQRLTVLVDWIHFSRRFPLKFGKLTFAIASRRILGGYLIQSVSKVVLQKSIPTQIRQLILYISNSKG